MVRSGDLSRPTGYEAKRLAGKTLELSADYLRWSRQASDLYAKQPIFFKATRRARFDRLAAAKDGAASERWAELYLRFRPIIGAAFNRAGLLSSSPGAFSDAVSQLGHLLQDEVERRRQSDCFCELLWDVLEKMAGPNACRIKGLREKLFFRSMLEEISEGPASYLELLCYLRGELMAKQVIPPEPLGEQELDRLDEACIAAGAQLVQKGAELDRLTKGVLTNHALMNADPGEVVRRWVQ